MNININIQLPYMDKVTMCKRYVSVPYSIDRNEYDIISSFMEAVSAIKDTEYCEYFSEDRYIIDCMWNVESKFEGIHLPRPIELLKDLQYFVRKEGKHQPLLSREYIGATAFDGYLMVLLIQGIKEFNDEQDSADWKMVDIEEKLSKP